ncbi:MAG TPA: histidine-type phosphatase [Chthoniobacterales bacterium]|nr:histidine-type phosphatase [Chthoniobacterales bacterium]
MQKKILKAFLLFSLSTCCFLQATEVINSLPGASNSLIEKASLSTNKKHTEAEGKLLFAIDVIRHGDRTPTADIPTAPHEWPEGYGKLTALGMRQEYRLGERLRSLYVDRYHLLADQYEPSSIFARSSDFDRTLMSADAFLMGLEPPGVGPRMTNSDEPALPYAYQPLPIHTVPKEEEVLLIPDNAYYHFEDLLARYVYPTKECQEKLANLQPKFDAWSKATGIPITHFYQLHSLGDSLSIDQSHQLSLPKDLSSEDVKTIIEAGDWIFIEAFKNPTIGKITGGELLRTIAGHLQTAKEQATPLKYVLFSAHDSTLLAQMSALGAPLNEVPQYASHLNISLFDRGNANYYVQVSYNGEPIILPISGSNSCTLEDFMVLAENARG